MATTSILYKAGDLVTVKSRPSIATIGFKSMTIELAPYPNLIGVPLTIESIDDPWVICTFASGSYAPALILEDLEIWEGTVNA
jgi:hypothetical protein